MPICIVDPPPLPTLVGKQVTSDANASYLFCGLPAAHTFTRIVRRVATNRGEQGLVDCVW